MMAPARRRRIMEVSREDSARCARRGGRRGNNRASAGVGWGAEDGAGRGGAGGAGRAGTGRGGGRGGGPGPGGGRGGEPGPGLDGWGHLRHAVQEKAAAASAAEEKAAAARPRRRSVRVRADDAPAWVEVGASPASPACVRPRRGLRRGAGVLVPAPGTARRGVGGLTKLRHESLRIKLQRGDADGSALRGRTRQQRGGWKDYAVARAVGWMGYAYEKNYKKISLH